MPTVNDAAALIRVGVISAEELTRACLETIENENDELNAFVFVDAEGALASAKEVDRLIRDGRVDELGVLAGVPFGVKDLEDCAGCPRPEDRVGSPTGPHSPPIQFTWAGCARPVRSQSARPRRRSSARGPIPRVRCSASPATRESRTHTRRIERRFECGRLERHGSLRHRE